MRRGWIIPLLSCLLVMSCASVQDGGFSKPAAPAMPADADDLKPGLAALYFHKTFVRHVDALPQGEKALSRGVPGPAISDLNRRFGRGQVFDSGTNRGIGVEMSGFILLEKPGRYRFQVNSNDGFRLFLDGRSLLEDPAWHAKGDQLTPPCRIRGERAGLVLAAHSFLSAQGHGGVPVLLDAAGQKRIHAGPRPGACPPHAILI